MTKKPAVLSIIAAIVFTISTGCESGGGGGPACVETECIGNCVLQGHASGQCQGDLCICQDPDTSTDPGVDTELDPGVDTGVDTGYDTGVDTVVDTGTDTGFDTGVDTAVDTSIDTGVDTGTDTSTDPGTDPNPLADLDISVEFPAEVITLAGVFFPTYLAHLIAFPAFEGGGWHFASVTIENTSPTYSYNVTASADLPGYSSSALEVVTVAPLSIETVDLDPFLNLTTLYAISSPVPGQMRVVVEETGGTTLLTENEAVNILPKNTVIWDAVVEGWDGDSLSAVMATPHDSGHYVETLIADAADVSMWGSLGGYQSSYMSNVELFSLSVGYYTYFSMLLEVGEILNGTLTSVVGGSDADIDVFILDSANFDSWTTTGSATACFYGPDSITYDTYSCTAPTVDWYYLVFLNTTDNFVSRDVTTRRYVSKEEVTRLHLAALFDVLYGMGMNYTSVTGSFFSGTQHVRLPSETLSGTSGNCIDGTLVFASALESLGMLPVLMYVPGHAFIGVQTWSDTGRLVGLETTWVNGGDFYAAYNRGLEEIIENSDAGTLTQIDIATMRGYGILPVQD